MSEKVLMKGNEALGEAAIRSGCRHFFGYPITPQTELSAYMAKKMPKIDGTFLQAESEVAAIYMVYGASAAGMRVMTSSSSPGISLKAEGMSYLAGADLPCVVVNIVRGGPGLGGIQPAQSDYYQATRGAGHGDYHFIVLAPNSVQEMVYFVADAFNYSDEYRIPAMILGDGVLGQMMEPVDFDGMPQPVYANKEWATTGTNNEREQNVVKSLCMDPADLEQEIIARAQRYEVVKEKLQRYEEKFTEDADIIVCSYGITSRIVETAVEKLRKEGLKVGIIRPITLWPFPEKAFKNVNPKAYVSVEMSMGQMIDDIKLATNCSVPVYHTGHTGGIIPTPEEIIQKIKEIAEEVGL